MRDPGLAAALLHPGLDDFAPTGLNDFIIRDPGLEALLLHPGLIYFAPTRLYPLRTVSLALLRSCTFAVAHWMHSILKGFNMNSSA